MALFLCVKEETQSDCIGVEETLDVCMVVADMPSVCTGLMENPPD